MLRYRRVLREHQTQRGALTLFPPKSGELIGKLYIELHFINHHIMNNAEGFLCREYQDIFSIL